MKFLKKLFSGLLVILVLLVIVYLLGPRPNPDNLIIDTPRTFASPQQAEAFLLQKERSVAYKLRLDNHARIVWHDSLKRKTPYAMVYIHGFGASQGEGHPVHLQLAETFGANLVLARLTGHGRKDVEAKQGLRAKDLMGSALEAIQLAAAVGDSVIVIGTSMGGALSLWAAPQVPTVSQVLLYSPAIRTYNESSAKQLIRPWGKKLMSLMTGGPTIIQDRGDSLLVQYWTSYYHVDAYEALMQLLYAEMTAHKLKDFHLPLYMAYYYKNEEEQDKVVSVNAMLEMMQWVSTPSEKKQTEAFPESGNHVIASEFRSADWRGVVRGSTEFLLKQGVPIYTQKHIPDIHEMIIDKQ